ncbi:MAG: HNH endonuclease [Xanthobacteraceae bacterium]
MQGYPKVPAALADPARTLPWRQWYGLLRWKRRARHQIRAHPLCAECEKQGRITPATIADHHPPHNGDWNAFRLGPLQSLCGVCHERKHNRLGFAQGASKAVDPDGFPIDPRHPFNRVTTVKT